MHQAEQYELMAPEQFGSQKVKTAIHQCLNKQLLYDLHWFDRLPAALCSNNAKSCYDRITLLAAALCLYQHGTPKSMVSSILTILYKMEHHICTTFGDSKTQASNYQQQVLVRGMVQVLTFGLCWSVCQYLSLCKWKGSIPK